MRAIEVSYSGLGGGSPARATFAQQAAWLAVQVLGRSAHISNIVRIVQLERTTPVESVVSAAGGLIARHAALRTTVTVGPADPRPLQRVDGEGSIALAIDEAIETDAAAVAAGMAATAFGDHEFPLRMRLVESTSSRAVVFVFSHLVLDGVSADLLMAEFRDELARPGEVLRTEQWTSLDQARYEGAARQQAMSARVEAYWKDQLERCPTTSTVSIPGTEEDPRWQRLRLRSVALAVTARLVALQHQVSLPSVLLAGLADLLSPRGAARFGCMYLAGNRVLPRLRNYVGVLNQDVILTMTVRDRDFAILAAQAQAASVRALRYACFDPFRTAHLQAQIELQQRDRFRFPVVNFRRFTAGVHDWQPSTRALAAIERGSTLVERSGSLVNGNRPMVAEVDLYDDVIVMAVTVDTRQVSVAWIADMLHRLDEKMAAECRELIR